MRNKIEGSIGCKPAAECCLYFYGFSGDLISCRDTREGEQALY
jgi:hypothetical protein